MTEQWEKDVLGSLELAMMGGGQIAYIRPIRPAEASRLIGEPVQVPADALLFCVCHADGTPMAITDSRAGALASVLENDLEPASVH